MVENQKENNAILTKEDLIKRKLEGHPTSYFCGQDVHPISVLVSYRQGCLISCGIYILGVIGRPCHHLNQVGNWIN